jgi:SAM-dependent methyltransferase
MSDAFSGTSVPHDRHFSSGPEPWEFSYRAAGEQRLWPPDPTIEALDLKSWRDNQVRCVLDAGCGDGKNMAFLSSRGFWPIGADASASALRQCAEYMNGSGFAGRYLLLVPSRLESIPLADGAVLAAVCIDVLGHSAQPAPILTELARVVGRGGVVYASVFHPEDSTRLGPRMRPGHEASVYWYRPSIPDPSAPHQEYFYQYYNEAQARELFSHPEFELVSLETRRWAEPPHKGYREEHHVHQSWFGTMVRR